MFSVIRFHESAQIHTSLGENRLRFSRRRLMIKPDRNKCQSRVFHIKFDKSKCNTITPINQQPRLAALCLTCVSETTSRRVIMSYYTTTDAIISRCCFTDEDDRNDFGFQVIRFSYRKN